MDKIDDPITSEANQKNGSSAAGKKDAAARGQASAPNRQAETPDPAELRPSFLSELATAMRATAKRERDRIAAVVAHDASAHVDKVRARAAIETEELRRLAEEDVQHIEEWQAAEIDRIRAEAEQRISDRRASLDEYLRQHDTIIETEIQGVDAAVKDYNATLDRFFEELSEAGDPAAIVERAESLPPAPDLDQVRAKARASAVAMFTEDEAPSAGSATAGSTPTAATAATVESADVAQTTEPKTEAETEPNPSIAEATAESQTADAVMGTATTEPQTADDVMGTVDASAEAPAVTASDTDWAVTEDRPAATTDEDAPPQDRPTASAEPVPVMEAGASYEAPAWPPAPTSPEMTPDGVESSEITPSVDHTSAAVRLLRSVAPWTAPTHAGSDRRPDTDTQ